MYLGNACVYLYHCMYVCTFMHLSVCSSMVLVRACVLGCVCSELSEYYFMSHIHVGLSLLFFLSYVFKELKVY